MPPPGRARGAPGSPRAPWLRGLLVALWVLGTVLLAGRQGASAVTAGVLVPFLVGLGFAEPWAGSAHRVLRKLGHVLAYAGFALLVRWALEGVARRARWALAATVLLATLDETLQAVSGARGGSVLDVLLDAGAGALALAWAERRERRALRGATAGGA